LTPETSSPVLLTALALAHFHPEFNSYCCADKEREKKESNITHIITQQFFRLEKVIFCIKMLISIQL
jgi:hypothetical protein